MMNTSDKTKVLTIVIPTYNMQNYLCRCLDSLIVPKELMKFLEVLVINDGSKDNSSAIAHEYQDKYPDTFRVIDKENGNYGSCVNRGLKEATGKYIKILDADDYYDTDNLHTFIKRLNDTDVDAVLSNHSVYANGTKKETVRFSEYNDGQVINVDKVLPSYFTMDNIAYKRQVFEGLNYHQTEGISYTDQEWIFYPMINVTTIGYFDLDVYQYMTGHTGQTMEMKTYYGRISQVETIVIRMLEYILSLKEINEIKRIYLLRVAKGQMHAIYRAELLINDSFNQKNLVRIESLWEEVDNSTYTSFNNIVINKYFPVYIVKHWHINRKRHTDTYRHVCLSLSSTIESLRRKTRKLMGLK